MQDGCAPASTKFLRTPLARLLATNLAIGTALAFVLVGGLLLLDPGGLRRLILQDSSPGVALGLLVFGFVVTLGSAAMGTAIMAAGIRERKDDGGSGGTRVVAMDAVEAMAAAAPRR
jgi:hypothetical protein